MRTLDLASASARIGALARDHDLARDLALSRDRASDLVRDLDHSLAVRSLDPTFALPLTRDRARTVANNLDSALALTLTAPSASESGKTSAQRPARRVTLSANGLAVAASRLLPAADQPRYREEYRCELWDLADAGAGRAQQIGYAIRLVIRAVPLRYAVLASYSRKAPP